MAEKYQKPSRPVTLQQYLEHFSSYTTFHGLHFVIGADRGFYRRVIWLVLILVGVGFLTKQLIESYTKLMSREHITTREMTSSKKLVFPAITICNENMMKKSKINGTDAQVYMDQQNINNKLMLPGSFSKLSLNSSFDAKKAVLQYGHTASDMFDACAWDAEFCSHLNFTVRYSQIYGLCHTFNSGRQGHPLLYSKSIKRSRGLHVFIHVQKDEYYGISSYFSTGIRMVIHDQDEEPMVETNGIDVMPGHMTTVNIQRTEYHSLKAPYQSACGSRNLETSKVYTQSTCLMECNTRRVMQKCGCRLLGMPDLPEFNGTSYCSPNEITSCLMPNLTSSLGNRILAKYVLLKYFVTYDGPFSSDNPQEECDCPTPCKQVQYKISHLSSVAFLSQSYWDDLLVVYLHRYPDMSIEDLKTLIVRMQKIYREDYIFLLVHYDDLHIHKTFEREAYELIDLGADVGGYLGLFLGCSILTIFELFDFIICYLIGKPSAGWEVEQAKESNGKL